MSNPNKDCFVVLATSKGRHMRRWDRCAKFFNANVRPFHPDVPVLVFSEGDTDLKGGDREKIRKLLDGPVEFRQTLLLPPANITGETNTASGICWFFLYDLPKQLKGEFDYAMRFDTDSHFLSPLECNFFDRLREQDAWYAYRGTFPEVSDFLPEMSVLLEYDGVANTGVEGMDRSAELRNKIWTNFSIFRRDLFDREFIRHYLDLPDVQAAIWRDRWTDSAVLTMLLSRAPPKRVQLWGTFKYGHGDERSPRYHMAVNSGGSFRQPVRWSMDADGNHVSRPRKVRKSNSRTKHGRSESSAPLPPSDRNKALCVIGDGLGNVVAQSCLVHAATKLFKEVHVWMPRSRPDLPDILHGMPGVASVNVQWIDAFGEMDAIFQTWLVAPQANGKQPNGLKARYSAPHPQGTGRNEVDVCMDAARKAGWTGPAPDPYVGWDPWPERTECAHDQPIFGFSTGRLHRPQWRFKEYPAASYAKVIDILDVRFPGALFLQIGWKHDTQIEHPRVKDTRRRGTIRQSLGLVNACTVFCGNDTGLCWAANAMKVPTVVVFGPTDPTKCLPPWGAKKVGLDLDCQPCQWRSMCRLPNGKGCDHACMRELGPSEVAERIIQQFEDRFKSQP